MSQQTFECKEIPTRIDGWRGVVSPLLGNAIDAIREVHPDIAYDTIVKQILSAMQEEGLVSQDGQLTEKGLQIQERIYPGVAEALREMEV